MIMDDNLMINIINDCINIYISEYNEKINYSNEKNKYIPLSLIISSIQNNKDKIIVLDLSYNLIYDNGLNLIVDILNECPNLTHLSLVNNEITLNGLINFVTKISVHKNIPYIDIRNNHISNEHYLEHIYEDLNYLDNNIIKILKNKICIFGITPYKPIFDDVLDSIY
jgi:hypothetical protein